MLTENEIEILRFLHILPQLLMTNPQVLMVSVLLVCFSATLVEVVVRNLLKSSLRPEDQGLRIFS